MPASSGVTQGQSLGCHGQPPSWPEGAGAPVYGTGAGRHVPRCAGGADSALGDCSGAISGGIDVLVVGAAEVVLGGAGEDALASVASPPQDAATRVAAIVRATSWQIRRGPGT
jgi:hypothetical protein